LSFSRDQVICASLCAALRPRQSRVFAFTPDARLARSLRLRYAVEPFVLSFSETSKTIRAAEKTLLERKFLPPGAKAVFITDILDQDERISSFELRTLSRNLGDTLNNEPRSIH
jgi:pyruvate kinase